MSDRFQVDLAGMVDLLLRHLYSGPQVYLRELLQNGVDAITVRQEVDPLAPARIRLVASGGGDAHSEPHSLEVTDTGCGLTAAEATELLATIGRSSKRDSELGLGRSEFIGQFGIGLLAAFMVAERIEVHSRSIKPGSAPIVWVGRADGTFEITEITDSSQAEAFPFGTRVRLVARPGMEHWLDFDSVVRLAAEYGSLLPIDISVALPADEALGATTPSASAGEPLWRRLTQPDLPWRAGYPGESARTRALSTYCEQIFGFTPLGHIDLALPVAGLSGLAFILPQAVSPSSGKHRVYLKRMLLGARVDRILPDWSFFVRAVIDTDTLSPTASREQLHEDEVLLGVRDALGEQLKAWILESLRQNSPLAHSVIKTHHLALRALALSDREVLDLVTEVLPFETTDGPLTLSEVQKAGDVVYATTTEAYRRVATVARAQGLVVVNAGYVYDADILAKLGTLPGWRVRELESSDLVQILEIPSIEREMAIATTVARARHLLEGDDCDVIVRTFSPDRVPAMLLRDSDGEHRRDLDRERQAAPELWGGLLDSFAEERQSRTRTLVLNDNATVTRQLLAATLSPSDENDDTDTVFEAGLRSLYLSAVMLAGEGLRASESAALGESLSVLLSASLNRTDAPPTEETP